MKVIKTPGPEYPGGPMRGHCYDGTGWRKCEFWAGHGDVSEDNHEGQSRCLLFGGASKRDSEALRVCDKVYGIQYDDEA